MGTWANAKDPSVYGLLEIDMKKTLELLPEYEKKHQIKVSPSHLVGKALSLCMKNRPEINGLIRGSKLYLRDHVSLFYQVSIPGKKGHEIDQANLSGATIEKAEQKEVFQIARELSEKASLVREGKDKEYSKNLNAFKYIPWWFSKYYLNIASWLVYGLNLDLSFLGIPKDPFGSAMITNVGSMGIDIGFAPLCPYTRVPLILLLGSIQEKAVVVDGQVVAREVLPIGVTFDHRFIDGVHASQMAKELKKCFEEPEKFLLK
ncbi:2-oxo acid dehydrogenase subunit E2 [Halobacteriovorax sp. GB3]|uniref:2-oxo acid dehydrogenase subunit E2 n=1 Tax=Halobacteriovorax sp. GB3 TaxID=2719615 RepID=UPI002361E134|nr:2-oxo acid dehydrogenase subunit E2 [Halobacteriovorax sp. GB3]MDD0852592.1 2-oxo acid dehydrogenase subunit E2 [Halobacteriovorax sp. GB3]